MPRSFVLAVTGATAWAVVSVSNLVLGVGTLALVTSLTAGAAQAGTAILPGWRPACGRQPRCFDRGEARRQARLNARYGRRP